MRKIAFAVALAAVALASASTTVYTSEATFLQNIQAGYYLEDFNGFTYGSPLDGSQFDWDAPGNGTYNFHAFAAQGLWSNTGALSTNVAFDPLVLTFPNSNPVTAFAGIVAATDISGNTIPYDVTVQLNDGTSTTINGSAFRGFTSTAPITSVTLTPVNVGVNSWAQIDHVYVGQVPEPASLVLVGLAGLLIRRR